jgi:DNA polymerase-1
LDELLDILYSEAREGRAIGCDIEDGTVDGKKVPLVYGFSWGDYDERSQWVGGARSVLLEHPLADNKKHLPAIKRKLAKLMADPEVKKAFQHGSYDQPPTEEYFGVKVEGYDRDSQYVTYLYDSARRSYSLESIIKYWFMEFQDYKTTVLAPYSGNFAEAPLDLLTLYNCADSDVTLRACVRFLPKISYELLQVYITDAFVLEDMGTRGPLLDWPEHQRLSVEIPKLLDPLTQQLRVISGNPEFNPGAQPQVAKLLYDDLDWPEPLNKEGNPCRSTDADFLSVMAKDPKTQKDPTPRLVLQWRALSTAFNTFLKGYARSAKAYFDELRTIWHLTGAATGRLRSSKGDEEEDESKVNLQNTHGHPIMQNLLVSDLDWRKALDEELKLKELDDLWVFLAADYSGIEVRILAEASGDPLLIQQFRSGEDVHSLVGHELTGIPAAKIKDDKVTRRKVKEFHFGIIYGLGPENGPKKMAAKGAPITKQEFIRFQKRYFARYKGVKRFIDKCHHAAEVTGTVTSLFGFTRRLRKVDENRSSWYMNQAVNTPIQNAAHQLILIAMALLRLKPKTYEILQTPVMEVHDELVFKVRFRDLLVAQVKLKFLLETGVPNFIASHFKRKLKVPLVSELSMGFTRGSMVKYEEGDVPTIERFLADWRAKYKKVSETPVTALMELE